jgi:hypothetical protein
MYILDNTATRTHYCDFKPSSLYSKNKKKNKKTSKNFGHLCLFIIDDQNFSKFSYFYFIFETSSDCGLTGPTINILATGQRASGYVDPCSFRPSKIIFVTFFSVTVDGRNLIFGHKRHIAGVDVTAGPLARGQW